MVFFTLLCFVLPGGIVYYPILYIISLHVGQAFGLHRSNRDSDSG